MTRRLAHICAVAWAVMLCLGSPGAAQTAVGNGLAPATLIADNIRFDGTSSVAANGSVEVFYNGARLRAQSITYDGANNDLFVEGPLTLTNASGNSVIVADFADLSADLQNGVLQSARLVLDRHLQIAATEINRTEGRYTQLYQAVASSCQVCFEDQIPLWEIRSRRVIHDNVERQLYFENAQLRVIGIPVFFLPRLRLPDPTLERATGFLVPRVRIDNQTGTHLRVPYFVRLGDHADVTLTPWIGVGGGTVEARYRQAFRNGNIVFNGAVTTDELTNDSTRAYVFGNGRFDIGRDFLLEMQLQAVSDRGYLTTYGFPDPDILESYVRLSRASRNEYIETSATLYESIRDGEDNDVLPTRVAHAEIVRRFTPPVIGGTVTAELEGTGLYRFSTDSPDGRDMLRVSGELDWRRTEVFGGLVATFETALHGGLYYTQQDDGFSDQASRLTPYGAVELRYPLQAITASGVNHVIEPVAQFVWSDTYGDAVPNEDSFIVEFDEANLFSLDRFPGSDQRETGARANLGLTYSRVAPSGWTLSMAGGVVLRAQETIGQFTEGSGLDGVQSDFLLATRLNFSNEFALFNRSLFDTNLDFTSSELSLFWRGDHHTIGTSYTYFAADLAEARPRDLSEWLFNANYGLSSGWEAGVNWRYDFVDEGPTRAGLSLGYSNECVDMEFTVSRRYTNSATVAPTTQFGFTVELAGFGASREGRSTTRTCRG